MAQNERRRNTRVPFQTIVDVRFGEQQFSGCTVQDLSVKGLSLDGVGRQTVGNRCDLTLCLSGTSSELCLQIEGEVVRVDESGVAVRFVGMDLDSLYHLKNIVYYNTEDPDRIVEELME